MIIIHQEYAVIKISVVNKDLSFKAKDLNFKAKDLTFKAKAKDLTSEIVQDRGAREHKTKKK